MSAGTVRPHRGARCHPTITRKGQHVKASTLNRAVAKVAATKQPRAVIYVRQSKAREAARVAEEGESISLPNQTIICRAHCDAKGYAVVAVIPETVTGRSWKKRKGVQRAIKMVLEDEADIVVVWQYSRLARRALHAALAAEELAGRGGRVESATEPYDARSAAGKLTIGMMREIAEYISNMMGEVWAQILAYRRRQGLTPCGGRRFGYRWVKEVNAERYEIDLIEGPTLEWMYTEYVVSGRGGNGIAAELNQKGIPTTAGNMWTGRAVMRILDSGFGAGQLILTKTREGQELHIPFVEREWVKGAQPPVITDETWDAFKAARITRVTKPPRSVEPSHELTGLLRCADCNSRLTSKVKPRFSYFACRRKIRTGVGLTCSVAEHRAKAAVMEWLQEVADDITAAAGTVDLSGRIAAKAKTSLAEAQKAVADIQRKLDALTSKNLDGLVDDATYARVSAGLVTERASATQRLLMAQQDSHRITVRPPSEVAAGLIEQWPTLPVRRRNELLHALIDHILITPAVMTSIPGQQQSLIKIVPKWGDEGAALLPAAS